MRQVTASPSKPLGPARTAAIAAALALTAMVAPLWSSPATAAEANVVLSGGIVRTIIPSRPAAGYFTLTNSGDTAANLVGAESTSCGSLMLHQTISDNGQESMVAVKSVVVPAHGSISFAPGGYHLMCMKPAASLKRGATVTITLRFADGGTLTGQFPVRGASGE